MKYKKIVSTEKTPIFIGNSLLITPVFFDLLPNTGKLVLINDSSISSDFLEPLLLELQKRPTTLVHIPLEISETKKTRETKAGIENQLFAAGCGRDTTIVALGGGVLTDLVGFIAATYCRGVPLILCPSTILGMIDASIGGKTGVNTPYGKNLIGAFYPPKAIYMDISVLKGLPQTVFNDGLAELIKHAALTDKVLFEALLKTNPEALRGDFPLLVDMLETSARIKLKITEIDQLESGLRACLNFGHTIGHAIESAAKGRYAHGQSIIFGMITETVIAINKGLCTSETLTQLKSISQQYGFHIKAADLKASDLSAFLRHDKKNKENKIHCSVLSEVGKYWTNDQEYTISVSLEECFDALKEISIF
ncbi:MAG: 3-dehydroquinate synthase [Legionellales bacterium]|nr:3-dehydroquinate synthase [Legionellales bacterium]|tara:strand:+ start:2571 stop:3665 length:1095 start_codon:yes stop_codon:yes gene_type:complete